MTEACQGREDSTMCSYEAMRQGGVYTNEVAARTAERRGHQAAAGSTFRPCATTARWSARWRWSKILPRLRRLEQVRTDFAANVSHELKTPLTSIRGFVETLENGAIDNPPMAHKFLRIIMLETERLTRLINDILSISKLESGSDEVDHRAASGWIKWRLMCADMLTRSMRARSRSPSMCHMNERACEHHGQFRTAWSRC